MTQPGDSRIEIELTNGGACGLAQAADLGSLKCILDIVDRR